MLIVYMAASKRCSRSDNRRMMHRSSDEIADERQVLGHEYGTVFYHCKQELWRISENWDRYEALFSTQGRVDVLNASGSRFWAAYQGILFEHVLLGICRLTDKPEMNGRKNLTIQTIGKLDYRRYNRRLHQKIAGAKVKSQSARRWRDKRIAHNDYDQMVGTANLLGRATRRRVTNAIIAIHEVLRWVQQKHFNSDTLLYDMGDSSAMVVLRTLSDGVECRRRQQKMWRENVWETPYNFTYSHLESNALSTDRYNK